MNSKTQLLSTLAAIVAITTLQLAWAKNSGADKPSQSKLAQANAVPNDPAFHAALLEIANQYRNYGLVDGNVRVSPALCSLPPLPAPRESESTDANTHGKKLYYLYAKDRMSYLNHLLPATGQAIVKESWLPKKDEAGVPQLPFGNFSGTKHGLFIMVKMDSKTPNTDEGWVYGTVSADGKTVSSSGRVQSCMGCHQQVPNGRLFGLKKLGGGSNNSL